ncbi:unnamed protein product, partial [Ranitomeya imitator]
PRIQNGCGAPFRVLQGGGFQAPAKRKRWDHITFEKRPPQNPEFIDPLANKKPRISHFTHRSQPTFNGKLSSSNGKDSPAPPTLDSVSSSSHLPPPHEPLSDSSSDTQHKDCEGEEASERLGLPLKTDGLSEAKQNCNPTRTKPKKKSRKHKERDRTKEKGAEGKQNCSLGKSSGLISGSSPIVLGKTCSFGRKEAALQKAGFAAFVVSCAWKYAAISSQEQRQSYKNDFNAEYNEYRDLHARIERITSRFTQLDSQLKQLCPGTEEYKTIHDQILQEYRKIKKSNPKYSEEKNRCEYLHNKLAHIKKLIAQYDQQQFQSWH